MGKSRMDTYAFNKKNKEKRVTRESVMKELDLAGKTELEQGEIINKELSKKFFFNKEKVFEFNQDVKTLIGTAVDKKPEKYKTIENVVESHNKMRPFFEYVSNLPNHLKKKQTGNELIQNAIELDVAMNTARVNSKISTSIPELIDTYESFQKADSFWFYDLETRSGRGATGFQQVDSIEEISMRKFNKVIKDGQVTLIEDESARIETLMGISPEQAKEYRERIVKRMGSTGLETEKDRVIMDRLAKAGHKDTVIEHLGDGRSVTRAYASSNSENLHSIENVEEGIRRSLEIYERQQKMKLSNGMTVGDDLTLKMLNVINTEHTAGFNNRIFDDPVIANNASTIWSNMNQAQRKEYASKYGFDMSVGPVMKSQPNKKLDLRDAVRASAELEGKHGGIYNDDELLGIRDIFGSLLSQETIGRTKVPNVSSTASHTAGDDVMVGGHLTGGGFFDELMNKIKKHYVESERVDKNNVFVGNQSEFFNDFSRKNYLNFTRDNHTGAIRTFGGISLEADGSGRDLGQFGKSFGIKKNVTYQIGYMGELDMNEEWRKVLPKEYQDYSKGKMYAMQLNPYMNKEMIGNNELLNDPIYYLFNSEEEMRGFVGSHLDNIGSVGPNGIIPTANKEIANAYSKHRIVDGKIEKVAEFNPNEIVNSATEKAMNDSAARMVRSDDYKKAQAFMRTQDYLVKNNAATVTEQKMAISKLTAQQVAGGGKISKTHEELIDILGYYDYSIQRKDLRPQTLNNVINSYSYMDSRRNAMEKAAKIVESQYGNASNEEKQYVYENLMRSLVDEASKVNGTSVNEALEVYGKELNFFEVNLPSNLVGGKHKKLIGEEANNILKVDLTPNKEYSLVNSLLKGKYGDNAKVIGTKESRQAYGEQALKDLTQHLNNVDEFRGQFDDVLLNGNIDVDINAERLIKRIKEVREQNPSAGFITSKEIQKVTGIDHVLSGLGDDFIDNSFKNTLEGLMESKFINNGDKKQVQSNVTKMIDDMLMPRVKGKDGKLITDLDDIVEFAANTYGYNKEQKEIFGHTIKSARESMIDGYTNLIDPILKKGGNVSYNQKTGAAVLNYGGSNYSLDLMNLNFNNGTLFGQVGNSRFGIGTEIDISKSISGNNFNGRKTKVVSNINKHFDDLSYLGYKLDRVNGDDAKSAQTILSSVSRVNKNLRELSSLNGNSVKDTFAFQVIGKEDALYGALPYLVDDMERIGGWQEEGLISAIRKESKRLKKGKVSSNIKELVAKDEDRILNMVMGIAPDAKNPQLTTSQKIVSMMSGNVKDTHYTSEGLVGDYNPLAFMEFDAMNRPNSHQFTNARIFDKNKLKTDLDRHKSKLADKKIDIETRFGTKRQMAAFNRHLEGVGDTVTGVTQNTLLLSDKKYKGILSQAKKNALEESANRELTDKIYNKLAAVNLTEQAQAMDGYLFDALFEDAQIQKISAKRDFIYNSEVNTKMMQKRIDEALPVVEIAKEGDIVFKLGKKSTVRKGDALLIENGYAGALNPVGSNYDGGLFGLGYVSKGTDNFIGEDEINRILNANKDKIKNQEDAFNIIRKEFDEIFYVQNTVNKGYYKMASEGVEKHMTQGLLSGLGTFDDRISEFLKIAKDGDVSLDFLQGEVATNKLIDEVLLKSYNSLSGDQRKSIGLMTSDEFMEAIHNEKFIVSEEFNKIFSGITSIGIDDTRKHKSAGLATRRMINDMGYAFQNDGMAPEQAYEKVKNVLGDYGVLQDVDLSMDEHGRIQVGDIKEGSKILNKNFEKMENDFMKGGGSFDKGYRDLFEKELVIGQDENVNAIKETFRMTRSTETVNRDYAGTPSSRTELGQIRSELKSAQAKFGAMSEGDEGYEQLADRIKELGYAESIARENNKTMKVSSREVNMLKTHRYDKEVMDDVTSRFNGTGNEKISALFDESFSSVLGGDGKLKDGLDNTPIHSGIINQYEAKLKQKATENAEELNSTLRAIRFNGNPEYRNNLIDKGFQESLIDDLIFPTGAGSTFLEGNENSVFAKNRLIKTSTGKEVALPAINYSVYNDEVALGEAYKSAYTLKNAEMNLQDAINGKVKGADIDAMKARVDDAAEGLKDAVDKAGRGVVKNLETIELDSATYKKANAAIFLNDAEGISYENFRGFSESGFKTSKGFVSIGELKQNDIHYNAEWHGSDFFKEYLDNYESYGASSRDEMANMLRTEGILGPTTRTPTIKEGSHQASMIHYLSDDVKSGQSLTVDSSMIRFKQDHDGDAKSMAKLMYEQRDSNNNLFSSSDYVSYHFRKQNGGEISAAETEFWESAKAANSYDAVTSNRTAYRAAMAQVDNEDEVAMNSRRHASTLMDASRDGGATVNPHLQRGLENDEVFALREKMGELDQQIRLGNSEIENIGLSDRIGFINSNYEGNANHELMNDAYRLDLVDKMNEVRMSKTGKDAVGEMNVPLFALKRVAETQDFSNDEIQYLRDMTYVLEESNISRKSVSALSVSETKRMSEAITSMVDGKSDGLAELRDVIDGNKEGFIKSIRQVSKLNGIESKTDDEIINGVLSVTEKTSSMFATNSGLRDVFKASSAQYNLNRYNAEDILSGLNQNNILSDVIEEDVRGAARIADAGINTSGYARKASRLAEGAGEVIQEMAQNTSGGTIAKAALGLAAAVMVTGYIGGNPTAPADNHAQEMNNYDSLQDKDLSIQQMQPNLGSGTGQGYVININAQSKKGQEHAMQAIQKAMHSSVPTDINIAMNVRDSSSNINTGFVDKLLAGAL